MKLEILRDPQTPLLFIRGARALRRTALSLYQGQIVMEDLAKLHERHLSLSWYYYVASVSEQCITLLKVTEYDQTSS